MQQELPGVKSIEGTARLCFWQCQLVPLPFGDFLSLSLCGMHSLPYRKESNYGYLK